MEPQPALTQPGITQPGVTQPGVTQPALTQPGVTQTFPMAQEPSSPISLKRSEKSSPSCFSPKGSCTRSPQPKKKKQERKGKNLLLYIQQEITSLLVHQMLYTTNNITVDDFKLSGNEIDAMGEIRSELYQYMLLRHAASTKEKTFISMQDFFTLTRATHTEKSNVMYLDILDLVADKKDTLLLMLHELYGTYISGNTEKYLVVEGDAKIYEILKSLSMGTNWHG